MSVNSVSRFNPYRVHPVSHSDGSPKRDEERPRYTPKKELVPVRRLIDETPKEGRPQPSMVGVFLDRWV